MVFNSLQFLLFFPVVLLVYYVIPDKVKYLWLLAASYFYYMCANAGYGLILLGCTAVTYLVARSIQGLNSADGNEKRRKLYLILGLLLDFGVLIYFKYTNFILHLVERISGKLGVQLHMPKLDLLLPVGISFFIFQAVGYTIDVYRGKIQAEKNFFKYALFVGFFPQILAGPIGRAKDLLYSLPKPKKFDLDVVRDGFLLMIWGFFLKLVLADRLALFVDTVYAHEATFTGWYVLVATVLFGIQIYCDFYGYSVMALGAAKMLGVDLMENFDAPYLRPTVAEFWRCWHISLTSWFRDYLYIPLGGSRRGKLRKYINIMIVFLVSGLWHGADLSFVVWGGLNGLYQVVGAVTLPVREKVRSWLHIHVETVGYQVMACLTTFAFVDFAWLFFKANNLSHAKRLIVSMLDLSNVQVLLGGLFSGTGIDSYDAVILVLGLLILFVADLLRRKGVVLRKTIAAQDYWCRCLVMIVAICFILVFGIWGSGYDAAGFIYFQF